MSNISFGQSMRSNYRIGFPIALQEQYCEQLLHAAFMRALIDSIQSIQKDERHAFDDKNYFQLFAN